MSCLFCVWSRQLVKPPTSHHKIQPKHSRIQPKRVRRNLSIQIPDAPPNSKAHPHRPDS